jgi:hypothetical protein
MTFKAPKEIFSVTVAIREVTRPSGKPVQHLGWLD